MYNICNICNKICNTIRYDTISRRFARITYTKVYLPGPASLLDKNEPNLLPYTTSSVNFHGDLSRIHIPIYSSLFLFKVLLAMRFDTT